MIAAWAEAMEESAIAAVLRNSVWAYPLVNAGHIFGVALLVGGSIPLCLRLLGFWSAVPLAPLRKILMRTAATGFLLAVAFGVLLFVARASAYAASPVFLAKMLTLVFGVAASSAVHAFSAETEPSATARAAAGLALAAWPSVLVFGRLVGYF